MGHRDGVFCLAILIPLTASSVMTCVPGTISHHIFVTQSVLTVTPDLTAWVTLFPHYITVTPGPANLVLHHSKLHHGYTALTTSPSHSPHYITVTQPSLHLCYTALTTSMLHSPHYITVTQHSLHHCYTALTTSLLHSPHYISVQQLSLHRC